jgi:hypothetical protein
MSRGGRTTDRDGVVVLAGTTFSLGLSPVRDDYGGVSPISRKIAWRGEPQKSIVL